MRCTVTVNNQKINDFLRYEIKLLSFKQRILLFPLTRDDPQNSTGPCLLLAVLARSAGEHDKPFQTAYEFTYQLPIKKLAATIIVESTSGVVSSEVITDPSGVASVAAVSQENFSVSAAAISAGAASGSPVFSGVNSSITPSAPSSLPTHSATMPEMMKSVKTF